ncbi:hypothetical protein C497_00555 [Halalkalicoccus jeotgali B3]|uniref:Uncharacterized protein n=1 Tax=Halalkalicoccus jeotgali (strain DSM 18796 / CECT 7217 / JCM 14584 / KCTC 4019 / B3) TaxID=795797 RepID=L9VXI3_HALJB|nr:hypothetical protein C497_00555 [Halalkalicoccus jeotgali B3]
MDACRRTLDVPEEFDEAIHRAGVFRTNFDDDRIVSKDRPAEYAVPDGLSLWERFTRDQRLVNRGGPVGNLAVDWDSFARFD